MNGNADGLSRWPLPDEDEDDIIINVIIIEKQNTKHRIIHRITKDASNNKKYIELEVQTISYRPINGANEQEKDTNIKWIIEVMKQTKSTTSPLQVKPNNREQRIYIKEFENLFLDKQTLWRRNNDNVGIQMTQFVAPQHQRNQIMQKFHDSLLAGHLMFEKTLIRIRNRFFWPEMYTSTKRYVETCTPCQLATHPHANPRTAITSIQTQVTKALELVTSDCLGLLKRSRSGNTNIMVVVDSKTKYAWFRATDASCSM